MASKNIGKLAVQLTADARPLLSAAGQARQAMATFGKEAAQTAKQAAKLTAGLAGVGLAVGGLATAAPVLWLRSMVNGLEQADRQARKLGVSIGELRGLQLAGGAAAQEYASAVGELNMNLARSAQGDLTARDRFAGVGGPGGITGGPEGLATVLDRLQAIPSAAARAAQGYRLLGDAAGELLPFLDQGGGGVRAAQDQARRFGMFVGENDLKAAKEVANVFREIGALWQGAQNQFALAIAPVVAELRSRLDLSGIDISGWRDAILDALERAAMWSASIIDALGDGTAWGAIKAHAREFSAVLVEGLATVLDGLPPLKRGLADAFGSSGIPFEPKAPRGGELDFKPGGAGGGWGDDLREAAKAMREAAQARGGFGWGGADAGTLTAPFRPGAAQVAAAEFAESVRARTGGNAAGPGALGWGGLNAQAMLAPFVKEVVQQFGQALGGVTGADPRRAFRQGVNDIGTFRQFGLFEGMPGAEAMMAFQNFERLRGAVQLPGQNAAPGAATFGSREAYSAALANQRQDQQLNVQQQMKTLLEEAGRQREAQIRIGEELLRIMGQGGGVVVKPI